MELQFSSDDGAFNVINNFITELLYNLIEKEADRSIE